jgi:hypothetical protein
MDPCYPSTSNNGDQHERKLVSQPRPSANTPLTALKVGHRWRNPQQDRRQNLKDKRSYQWHPGLNSRPPRHPLLSDRGVRIRIQNALSHSRYL